MQLLVLQELLFPPYLGISPLPLTDKFLPTGPPQLPHLLTILCEPFLLTLPPCLHEFCAQHPCRRVFRYHFARTQVGNENGAPPTKCWVNSCRDNWNRATWNIYLPSYMIFAPCWKGARNQCSSSSRP